MDPRPGLVVLLCGVAGSGKTTYAERLVRRGFTRLSVDVEIWRRFGRYGADYPASSYDALQVAAEEAVRADLVRLLGERAAVVVDLSLWRRGDRDAYKALVEAHGGEWALVHLSVPEDVLRARLRERAGRCDADAAFPIGEERLAAYLASFESPVGEGEVPPC